MPFTTVSSAVPPRLALDVHGRARSSRFIAPTSARAQVPPPHSEKGDKGGKNADADGKRSKFVVLQNTISAIHALNVRAPAPAAAPPAPPFVFRAASARVPGHLVCSAQLDSCAITYSLAFTNPQAKVAAQEAEIQRLHAMLAAAQSQQHAAAAEAHARLPNGHGAAGHGHGPFGDDSERAAAAPASAPAHSAETTGSDSSNGERDRLMVPEVPAGQSVPGVEVDMGPEHCYLKVTCPDRRGLLADVLHALRTLPLEITRAAITTGPDGFATDIFELKQTFYGTEKEMSAEEIQAAVEAKLKEAEEVFKEDCDEFLGGKRKKRPGVSSAN